MSWMLSTVAAFFAAILGAMGMGGGGILLIYLTLYANVSQMKAQGINLVFFIPIASLALIIHSKNKLVCWKVVLPCVLWGVGGVILGSWLAQSFGDDLLSRLFGGFLLLIGLRELFSKKVP